MTDQRPNPVLCFAETCLAGAVVGAELTQKVAQPAGWIDVRTAKLPAAGIDFAAEVRLYSRADEEGEGDESSRVFTGSVSRVEPRDGVTRLWLVAMPTMDERRLAGWGVAAGIPETEMVWSLARTGGIPENRLRIDGFSRRPELIEVIAPLDGLAVERPFRIGKVAFASDRRIARLAGELAPNDVRERFVSAVAWAVVLQRAGTLLDAEQDAIRGIDTAVAVLMLRAQFSSPHLAGAVRDWDRKSLLARVRRRDAVVVRSVNGRRWWLRALTDLRAEPNLAAGDRPETLTPPLARWVPDTVREAIRSWHRAVVDPDPVSAVGALWEAVEFYVADTRVAGLFSKAQGREVLAGATAGLDEPRRQRVAAVLAMLNEPSLSLKLEAAMKEDAVPYTEAEFAFLTRMRSLRNDQVHGRARVPPTEEDLQRATALVNRLLAYRLHRLSRRPSD
jgi:hypothetical protein